ncbi:uroporphyrinogen decarboxylase family protein [Methanomassiliicoccus luminyensis]|uniref:uroporphyrinogen decarboxylase family protein n=1 Tax=Methanomassiliicoccus luminyensis TaxID=1080712 RepID=UPI00067452D9|nr:uroporphyrinogen decarboxylase family protein [Methanomassiliicoccus luminyensis]
MNSRELFRSHMMSEDAGKRPIFLFDLSLGMDVLNVPTPTVYPQGRLDGELGGRSILALQRHLGHDAVVGSYQSIDFAAFGGKKEFPERGIPYVSKAPFEDATSLYRHDPSEIEGFMGGTKASFSTVRKGAPDVALLMNIPAPMSTAVPLRGLQTFLMDLYLDPGLARDLIRFGGEVSKITIEGVSAETDLDAVLLTAAFDNIDLIGPDALRSFSFGELRGSMSNIRKLGLPIVFHPHSVFTSDEAGAQILSEMIGMGVDCLYYGESNDPGKMVSLIDGKCSIMGGIDTFTTICLGPDDRVARDVNDCLGHFDDVSYIFTCSCSVDRGLPLGRMKLMADAVRSYVP